MENGLTSKEVLERTNDGRINNITTGKTKSIKEIILTNVFTYFNILNILLAAAIIVSGILFEHFFDSFKNCLFLGVVLANTIISIVQEILAKKTVHAIVDYDVKNLILAGGVSANSGIRRRMEEISKDRGINFTCPEIKYCTDNAAMIASAGYYAYLDGRRADFTLNGQSSIELK